MTAPLPLEGVTVVSLEQAVAAPFATRTLADLGARVIKVERTDGGDFARGYDDAVGGTSSHFFWLNRSKESVALDVKSVEGRTLLAELVAGADVVVQNLAPGAAARLGLGADELRERHPGIVVADMTGYGDGGAYAGRKAYDMLVQAEAGLVAVTGTEDHPAKTGIPSADVAAGLHTAHAVLAALVRKGRTGQGAHVRVSMFDALTEWMGHPLYTAMHGGRRVGRNGLAHPAIVPYDAYPAADGQVLVGVQNDRQWQALVGALGRDDLATDADLATNRRRVAERDRVDAEVARSTAAHPTASLLELLADAGVPAAQVTEVDDLAAHPQLQGRDRWADVATEHGTYAALRPPALVDGTPARMDAVPALGEHTDRVLAELDRDPATIRTLRETGVVA
ncbi:CoA transferase [Marmoricola endophyticus]|uniref:CoA transferase n=1 Tax=Marmoricola endophyticus TaxID=2040280 RepID=A0A917BKY5_9ACTN|nr:CaiB/BaiF CoA-transferase family protein [Marmoricola endophyticus]GGF48198.1 CoA transferase [Marmoricola endophyticus]